jgi:hypothetical protein
VKVRRHAPQRRQENHDEHRHCSVGFAAVNDEIRAERREHRYRIPEECAATRGEDAHRRDREPADQQAEEQLMGVRPGIDREDQDRPGATHRRRTGDEAALPERGLGHGAIRGAVPPHRQVAQRHDDARHGEPGEQHPPVGRVPEQPDADDRHDDRER